MTVAPATSRPAVPVAALLVAAGAAFALVVLLMIDGTRWVEVRVTDAFLLVKGSHAVEHCLRHGVFTSCSVPNSGFSSVGAWPITQYLVAVPLIVAGIHDFTALQVLAATSSLAVGGMLLLIAFPIRRLFGDLWAVVFGVSLLTSPFVLYALLPLGEALAAFLALAFVVAACARRPGWLFVTGFLAGTTKETVAPFLFVLAVVCARDARDRSLPERRLLVPIVAGLTGAVVVNGAFNVFRFGTIRNLVYTAPKTRVPGITIPFRLATADWFAPNVGVVWFWSVAGMIVAGLFVATLFLVRTRREDPRQWLPPLAVVAVVVALTVSLGFWYSTFGWVAWGPRLTLPLLPAILVAAVRTAPEPMTAGLRWVTATVPRAVFVGALVAVLGAAQVGVVWQPAAIDLPLVPDAACPQVVPIEQASTEYFYGCGLHQAWRLDPLSLWEGARHGPTTQAAAEVLEITLVAGAVAWLHRRNRKGARPVEGAKPSQA